MTIATNDGIWKFGTQDEVTSGTPEAISNDAYGKADQGGSVNWTNDDNVPYASAVLKARFTTTMPTVGNILLLAHLQDVQSTNDPEVPSANFPNVLCGAFRIPFGVSAGTYFYATIPHFELPQAGPDQAINWYLKNNGTAQSITVSWQLWIRPKSLGPKA